jgi:hypothetical protein
MSEMTWSQKREKLVDDYVAAYRKQRDEPTPENEKACMSLCNKLSPQEAQKALGRLGMAHVLNG